MPMNVGQELLNVPMGEMIKSMATAIAEAQWQLDKSSMTVAELMSGQRLLRDLDTGKLIGPNNVELPEDSQPTIIDSRVYFGYTYEKKGGDGDDKDNIVRKPQLVSMMELGFVPNFYQFVDTIIEVKISITVQGSQESSRDTTTKIDGKSKTRTHSYSGTHGWWRRGGGYRASHSTRYSTETRATTVDAKFSNKYSYSIEGSSLLRTKLVPIPPPSILEDRIRQIMDYEQAWRNAHASGAIKDGVVIAEDKQTAPQKEAMAKLAGATVETTVETTGS